MFAKKKYLTIGDDNCIETNTSLLLKTSERDTDLALHAN